LGEDTPAGIVAGNEEGRQEKKKKNTAQIRICWREIMVKKKSGRLSAESAEGNKRERRKQSGLEKTAAERGKKKKDSSKKGHHEEKR